MSGDVLKRSITRALRWLRSGRSADDAPQHIKLGLAAFYQMREQLT